MSIKSKLMTSAAALTLVAGAAFAESHTSTETQMDGEFAAGWNADLDQQYGDIADRQVAELIGMNVLSENGEDVGEVDNFVIMDDQLKAVVGVGGFLGLGEHEVAIALSEMTYEGDALVISFTKEELEAMPEYTDELEAQRLAETDTFRTRTPGETETASIDGATGDMENASDGSEEMAGNQTVDAQTDAEMNIDEEQTAEADTMETVEEGQEVETAEVDPGTDEDASPSGEEVAAAEEAAEQAGQDGDTMTEEVAENEQGEIEQEAEEIAAEAEATAEAAGDEVADAADATGEAVEGAATEAGEEMAEAGEAVEGAAENAGEEVAQAAESTENAVEGAATEAGEEMAEAGEAVEGAAAEAGEEVAQAAEATENAVEGAAAEAGDWMANFAEIAEWEINELEGKDVATANGDVIGEIDDLARQNGKVVALVGIGGFLGLGEHDVALEMSNLSWDGEKFIAEGYSEEDLKAMNEYDAETVEMIDDSSTLKAEAEM